MVIDPARTSEVALVDPCGHARLILPLASCGLDFERRQVQGVVIDHIRADGDPWRVQGHFADTSLKVEIEWRVLRSAWFQTRVTVQGRPDPAWGRFLRLHVVAAPLPPDDWDDTLGWREVAHDLRELDRKPAEEGGGYLPPFGYPVFGTRLFAGLEHPMGVNRVRDGVLDLSHHPAWRGDRLESFTAVFGFAAPDERVADAFQRYLRPLRRPPAAQACVEINTFWTDVFAPAPNGELRYATDLPSYRRLIEEWSDRVLAGERGLVTNLLLDAGWQEVASLFRPQTSLGGPGDDGLARLASLLQSRGLGLGLWWSWNGPIGISDKWVEAQGWRVSASGTGAGYSCAGGKLRYACLTDPAFEQAMGARIDEVLNHVPVAFFKGDWDNDGIEDPALYPGVLPLREQMMEANTAVIIRLYQRALSRGAGFRGGWWLSPWWTLYANNTHLPNSGDSEASDLPALTQRDAIITSRDTLLYHVMVTCRTPVPWDFVCNHEFAAAPRNPVQDTDESWLNNLIMWIARGANHIHIYMPPYNLRGWRAWALREVLRWYRAHEDLLWKGPMRLVGGDPGRGAVYGYLHQDGSRCLLALRNPAGWPQRLPAAAAWGLPAEGWTRLYPLWEPAPWQESWLPAHEVQILVRETPEWQTDRTRMRTDGGWAAPFDAAPLTLRHGVSAAIPELHGLKPTGIVIERPEPRRLVIHADLPYGCDEVEWVLRFDGCADAPPHFRAAVGRYAGDAVSSAPLPIRWCRPHWRVGWGQKRMAMTPYDQQVAIARLTTGSGGRLYLTLHDDAPLPSLTGGWIEARLQTLPCPDHPDDPACDVPPSLPRHPVVLAAFDGAGLRV